MAGCGCVVTQKLTRFSGESRSPQGKQGVNIDKAKYDTMRNAIVETLGGQPELTFTELNNAVGAKLEGNFDGSIGWYYTTVKLDLEARSVIERGARESTTALALDKLGVKPGISSVIR